MPAIVVVNELTVFWLLLSAWRGGNPDILIVDPLIPPLAGVLERAARWAESRGARRLIERFPQHREAWDYPALILGHDVLARIEPWQNSAFQLDTVASRDNDYGIAVKLVVTTYLFRRYMAAFLLAEALKQERETQVRGLSPALHGLAVAWLGADALPGVTPPQQPAWILNLLILLPVGLAAGLAFIARRIRATVALRTVFLMADFNNDPRDFPIYEALADRGPCMLLMRNADIQTSALPGAAAFPQVLPEAGAFDLRGAVAAAAMVLGDGFGLFRRYGRAETGVFWQIALLPYRRSVIRALFNRIRPRIFWSRDDYNVEHVIRRQELHRVGGKQYGLNHAIQGITILMPQMRHVSMDTYFTMGRAFHSHYRDTWHVDRMRSIGSFAFSADYLARPRRTTRDILFMARFAVGNPEFVKAVRATAAAFPDRTILLQVKTGYPHEVAIPEFIAACSRELTNVRYTAEPVYDLILTADMVVSDASTIIAELIELGTPVFMLDVLENHRQSIYRQFPGLTVRTAEAAVAKLLRLARGDEVFDRSAYGELINLDGPLYTQAIRDEMTRADP